MTFIDAAVSIKKPFTQLLAVALPSLLLSAAMLPAANANLITNGSFESVNEDDRDSRYGSSSTWQIYSSLPSWDASRNIEVWSSGFKRVHAPDGQRFIELNAHPRGGSAFSIYQDFATESGTLYDLSFFARKRTHGSENFEVSAGSLLESIGTHVKQKWTQFKFQFVGDAGSSRISFASLDGGRDTTGNFIDDIRVTAASVPEPGIVALLALGVAGLGFSRRQSKRNNS